MSETPKFEPPPPPLQLPMKSSASSIAKRPITWAEVRAVGTVGFAIVAVAFAAYFRVIGDARAEVDAGVKVLTVRVDEAEQRIARTNDEIRATRSEVKEVQADIRALYRAMRTGEKQPRLELDAGAHVLELAPQ